MSLGVVLQILSTVVPTGAVIVAWASIRRQAVEHARAGLEGERLAALADALARMGRDLRDAVSPPGGCPGCGKGVPAGDLIQLGEQVDRAVDLALVHVRDEELTSVVGRARAAAWKVRRHPGRQVDACDELLADSVVLASVCDRAAEATLAYIHTGSVRARPHIRTPLLERAISWFFDRVFPISEDML